MKSYSINRTLSFNEQTGYWSLTIEVTASNQVSEYPFLLEKPVLGSGISTTLSSDVGVVDEEGNSLEQKSVYLRTLLESEAATQRLKTDPTIYDKYTWVQYRSSSFSKDFYTYEQAADALNAVVSVLKSNARVYESTRIEPRLVGTNLSSKQKEPSLERLTLTKGDTVSLQLVNGTTDTSIITDGSVLHVSQEYTANRRKSNSYVVTVTSDTMTFIGIRDDTTQTEYKLDVSMNTTSLEGGVSEIIR